MAKFLIWVNTFQREDLLQRFLDSIKENKKDHIVDVFVFKDNGIDDYIDVRKDELIKLFYSSNQHYGKVGYWKLINEGLSFIKDYQRDYDIFIKTDDDMVLCDNFFDICLENWNIVKDSNIFSLDILSIPRQRGRTLNGNKVPLTEWNPNFSFYETQWVDMNFIFNITAFAQINFKIETCSSGLRTSGVGLYLTRLFNKLNYKMLQMPISLLIHGSHSSKMHSHRVRTPMISQGLK